MSYPKIPNYVYSNLGGINVKVSLYQTGPHEQLNIENLDFQRPGSLSSRPGSTAFVSSGVLGRITGVDYLERSDGYSAVVFSANTNFFSLASGAPVSIRTGLQNNQPTDSLMFFDRMFVCEGSTFFKTDGVQSSFYSLPEGTTPSLGTTTLSGPAAGTYRYAYGYVNDRGYVGPAVNFGSIANGGSGVVLSGFTTPTGYGISQIIVYRTLAGNVDLFELARLAPGSTVYADTGGVTLTNREAPDYVHFTLAPKFLELYNNQLFMGGFATFQSRFYFSDIAEPEGVERNNFADVRTNDGDRLTAMKTFGRRLIFFKDRSLHELYGDDVSNFVVRQIDDQYGCVNNKALVEYPGGLLFLDRRGVIRLNGSDLEVMSNKVDDVFSSMNLDAAMQQASAEHFVSRNEVWFSIPTDGATFNNTVVVHDYLVNAWTTFKGPLIANMAYIRANLEQPTIFYGGYSSAISYFGDMFTSDVGAGITYVMKSKFFSDQGNSITKQWRRLFVDVDRTTPGVTVQVNFYTDYSATASLTRYFNTEDFQARIDFGLPAKALSVEFVASSSTLPFRINGFTVESRYQRSV